MAILRLKAVVTADRQLKVDLPDYIPVGEIEISLELPLEWQEGELEALMAQLEKIKPQSGAEIAAWLEQTAPAYRHIEDIAAWVEEQRRQQQEHSQW